MSANESNNDSTQRTDQQTGIFKCHGHRCEKKKDDFFFIILCKFFVLHSFNCLSVQTKNAGA